MLKLLDICTILIVFRTFRIVGLAGTLYLCGMRKENNQAIVYAGLAVLSWSTVATAFKIALTYLTHYEMLLIASCTALLIFALSLTLQRKWNQVCRLSARQWFYFAGIGLLNPVAYYLVLFKAYNLLPAQVAQPINYAWPIVLLVLLAVFARQPIPPKKYIGMFLSLGGVVFISIGGTKGEMSASVGGLLLAGLSAILWASFWLINNRNSRLDGSVSLFMTFLFGTIYLIAGACVTGVNLHSLPGVLSGVYIGCFEIGIPFIFFGLAMRKTTNPALINQLCYLSPFLSLFLIAVVLGEHIVATTYVGLVLIVGGIVYNQYFVKEKHA